ncbi:MAG: DUF547 domain-containing protein [Gammaproteobacteria bacterium]|nr:MAG: DUF547 domain-containing protein [Gammaproteobacteria bacterium]
MFYRVLSMILVLMGVPDAQAAPRAEYWAAFDHFATQTVQVDHSSWAAFLKKYVHEDVSGQTRVAYGEVTETDRGNLKAYIRRLSGLDPRTLDRPEAMAYWINLYNALTVQLVLAHYPVETIRSIHEGWFAFGPWDDPLITVAGHTLTLNDIEHRILRPLWKDYRIHFAVNCASLGCPDLNPEPYYAGRIEAQLAGAQERFLAQHKAVHQEGGHWVLSSIFDWYGEDFGGRPGVIRLILRHSPQWTGKLTEDSALKYDYDWRLNQWPAR